MIVDMHVHTNKGGYDSMLSVPQLIGEAQRRGLDGVCVTEHCYVWSRKELRELVSDHHLTLFSGTEVETDMGHIIVFGLDRYISGIHRAAELRRVADDIGGFVIAAHPFRRFFELEELKVKPQREWDQVLDDALHVPVLDVVDDIEVLNGGCNERENLLAAQVAQRVGMRGTAGSDAHSTHGLGRFVTVFERELENEVDLIAELKAGRFFPASRTASGEVVPLSEEGPFGP